MSKIYPLLLLFGLVFFIIIIELIRKKHLREKYAILWLFITIGMIVGFFSQGLITKVSNYLGVYYPPTLVFIAAILALLLLDVMLSIIDSHQTNKIIELAQKLAILEKEVTELKGGNKGKRDKTT